MRYIKFFILIVCIIFNFKNIYAHDIETLLRQNLKNNSNSIIYNLGQIYYENQMYELAEYKFDIVKNNIANLYIEQRKQYLILYIDSMLMKIHILLYNNKFLDAQEELIKFNEIFPKYYKLISDEYKKKINKYQIKIKLLIKWHNIHPADETEKYLKNLFMFNFYKNINNYNKYIEYKTEINKSNIKNNIKDFQNIENNPDDDYNIITNYTLKQKWESEFDNSDTDISFLKEPQQNFINILKYFAFFQSEPRKASYLFNNAAVLSFQKQDYEQAIDLFYNAINVYSKITDYDLKKIYQKINICYLKLYSAEQDINKKQTYKWLTIETQQKLKLIN